MGANVLKGKVSWKAIPPGMSTSLAEANLVQTYSSGGTEGQLSEFVTVSSRASENSHLADVEEEVQSHLNFLEKLLPPLEALAI